MGSELLPSGGKKNDTGKLRMDLIPGYPLMRLAEVYTIGAAKYADDNWRSGISYKRIFAALMRHAWKWFMGETHDPQDGQHHLSSVAWCAFTLMEYEISRPEFDDRPTQIATHRDLELPIPPQFTLNKEKPTASGEEVGLMNDNGSQWINRPGATVRIKLPVASVEDPAAMRYPVQAEQSQRSELHPVTSSERHTEVPLVDKHPASYSR